MGLMAWTRYVRKRPEVPIVVLSGLSDEAVAINAVQEGAQDYLVKGSVDSALLVRSLRYAIERQHLRVALRESESRYRLLADNAADVIWTANMKWRITYVSPSIKRLLGYTVEEMKKLAINDILTPDSLKQASKIIRNQMEIMTPGSQHPPLSLTLEHVRKDGSTLWAEVMLSFLWDKDGKLSEIMGVTREITERKKAEEALRQSEQRYRLLAENVKDVIWIRDMNLKLTYTSPSVLEMSGYSVEEVMSMSLEESLTPASLELIRPVLDKVLAAGEKGQGDLPEVLVLEAELIHKDGSIIPVEMKVNLLRDSDGQPTGFLGVTRDITERKKAEEALRESQEELQAIFDNARDGIALFDLEGRLLKVNKRVLEVGGYTTDEIAGKTFDLLEMFTPESIERMFTAKDMILSGKEVPVFECEACTKSGRKLNLDIHVSPFFLKGKRLGSVSIMRDITERKKAEEALRESEERYRELFENANDIIYTHDLAGNFTSINKAGERVTGYMRNEVLGMNISSILTPASLELARQMTARKVGQGGSTQYELEIVAKDGHRVPLEISSRLIYEGNKPVSVQGIARDITERKRMEQALRQSEHNYRVLFESTIDGMFVTDVETMKVLLANQTAAKMCGFASAENAIGINPLDLVHPDDREQVLGFLVEDAFGEREQEVHEFRVITKDGREIWVSGMGTRIEYGGKLAVLSSIRDITERKRAEEQKKKMEEQLRLASRLAAVGELAAGVAHELNNPIAAIQGFAQFLAARKDLDETTRKDLDTIYRESQRAAKITRNLLSFARRHEPEKHLISH